MNIWMTSPTMIHLVKFKAHHSYYILNQRIALLHTNIINLVGFKYDRDRANMLI